MNHIVDRQTFVISVNFANMTGAVHSQVILPMNLRFTADELVLKSITYNTPGAGGPDVDDVIQIWCNVTNDGLIGAFPNSLANSINHNEHFRISNNFQNGNFMLQFQQTTNSATGNYNPQPLTSAAAAQTTFGIAVIVIEFVKLAK
jgi:hypothetical protein